MYVYQINKCMYIKSILIVFLIYQLKLYSAFNNTELKYQRIEDDIDFFSHKHATKIGITVPCTSGKPGIFYLFVL